MYVTLHVFLVQHSTSVGPQGKPAHDLSARMLHTASAVSATRCQKCSHRVSDAVSAPGQRRRVSDAVAERCATCAVSATLHITAHACEVPAQHAARAVPGLAAACAAQECHVHAW
jgi:hypothetical protein